MHNAEGRCPLIVPVNLITIIGSTHTTSAAFKTLTQQNHTSNSGLFDLAYAELTVHQHLPPVSDVGFVTHDESLQMCA